MLAQTIKMVSTGDKVFLLSNRLVQIAKRCNSRLSYLHQVGEQPLKPLTMGQLLENAAQTYPDREAVVACEQQKRVTFSEVLDQADRLAAGLRSIGLKHGDRVGIWAPNYLEWYISFLGCARAGLVTAAMNPAFQAQEVEFCIQKVGVKAIISGYKHKKLDFYDKLNKVIADLGSTEPGKVRAKNVPTLESVITITDQNLKGSFNFQEILDKATPGVLSEIKKNQHKIAMDEPFNIQFTSGTTGTPKAAAVSHFNLVNNGFLIGKRNGLNKKHHKICIQVPLFHAFGTSITISASLNHGATLVLPSITYDPDKSLDAIKNENCTAIHGTPTMYVDLINRQMERKLDINPDFAVAGGACCSPHLFKKMKKHLNLKKVKSVYGLSETTAVVFQSQDHDDQYKSTTTVGYIQEHTEAKVIDENGNIVPRGVPGELCVRGYMNMLEYWGDEVKTKETIGTDGWLLTGDQFVMEEDGYGRVVGRLKEMIIRGGENIFPKEIEDHLNTHPDIIESHVIGIPHERLGEEVCACVRVKDGATITVDTVKEYCKEKLSHFKVPSRVITVDAFPKTQSGKIQKFKLVAQYKNKEEDKKEEKRAYA